MRGRRYSSWRNYYPTDAFYIVAQFDVCDPIHPDDYVLSVKGLVNKPMELTLSDIQQLPSRTIRTVMECAGDDGEFFHWQKRGGPKPSRLKRQKEQGGWNQMGTKNGERPKIEDVLDAVPTTCLVVGGEWTGVPLVHLLTMVGVKPGVESVHFVGYDKGRPDPTPQYTATGRTDIDVVDPGIINYDKALPLDKAMHPDTLLAWAHNGEYELGDRRVKVAMSGQVADFILIAEQDVDRSAVDHAHHPFAAPGMHRLSDKVNATVRPAAWAISAARSIAWRGCSGPHK